MPYTDKVVEHRYGIQRVLQHRVAEIVVNFAGARVRRYALTYDLSPDTTSSRLRSVQQFGLLQTDSLPAQTFDYQLVSQGMGNGSATFTGPNTAVATDSAGSKIIDTADLNGDGYLDWIDATNTNATYPYWMVSLGNGTTAFNAAAQWKSVTKKIRVYKPSNSTVGSAATISPPDVSQDLIDMTGDGLSDLLYVEYNSSVVPPRYEFKILKNNGSGFNGTPVLWGYPAGYTAPSVFRTFTNTISGTTPNFLYSSGISDMVDLTGDACPDFIRIESGVWQLYRNQACDVTPVMGFAAPVAMNWRGLTPPTALSYAKQQIRLEGTLRLGTLRYYVDGPSKTLRSLLDLNGDGIVDVFTGFVYFGTGEGFIQESADSTFGSSLNTVLASIDVDKPISYANNYGLHVTVADLNADGRPDVIRSNADILYYDCLTRGNGTCTASTTWSNDWTVYLNTGSSFQTTATPWLAARFVSGTFGATSTESAATEGGTAPDGGVGTLAAGTYYPFGFIHGTNPTYTAEHNKYQFGRFSNFDGEGAVDFLRGNGTSWTIYKGSPARPDLLIKANTGLGGNTTLAYADTIGKRDGGNLHFPRTTLQSQVTKDGLDTVGAGVQTTYTTTYSYSGSYYDRAGREFNGFGKVAVVQSDNTGSPISRTETQFAVGNPSRVLTVPLGPDPSGTQCTESWTDNVTLAGMPIAVRRGPHTTGTDADFLRESWSPWESAAGALAGVFAPELRKSRVIDRDLAGVARKLTATKRVYGSYGNITSSTNLGETQATSGCGSLSESFASDEVTTSLSYATNTAKWSFAPQTVRVCADQACATVLRDTKLFYDNLAQGSIDKGDLTRREVWSQFGAEAGLWVPDSAVFDAYGNVTRQTDPDGAVFEFVFADGAGGGSHAFLRSSSVVVAKGKPQPVTLTASTAWDEKLGIALSTTAPNGRRVSQATDGLGRVTQVKSTPPESATGAEVILADVSYSLTGATGSNTTNYVRRLSYFAAAQSIESRTYLDGLGRPVQAKSQAEGAQWITSAARATYFGSPDVSTLPYFTTVPEFSATVFSETNPATSIRQADFDWAGRVTSQKLVVPGGATHFVTSASHTLWDQRVTDPKGISVLYQRDGYGRIAAIKENLDAAVTRYAFDRVGALTSVTDAANNVILMRYDTRGLRRELEDADLSNCGGPQNCARKFSFDLSGRLTRQIDAKAQEKLFSLDELGRPYLQHYVCTSCGEVDVAISYDGSPNALGLATRVERGATNVLAPTFDNWQRVTNVSQIIADSTFAAGMTFDWHGRVQNLTYPTGEIASYFYNARGAANRLTFAGADIVSGATYDALGRSTELAWGNGLFTRMTFKPNQLLSTIRVENAGATHLAFDYRDHDLNGNPTRIYEDVGFPGQGAWNREYQYDWANRLTIGKHWVGATLEKDWEWRYDDVGNMTYNKDWTGAPLDGAYSYGASAGPHAATKVGGASSTYTLAYDQNGGLVSETTGGRFTYNVDGRTATAGDVLAPVNPNVTFTYDGGGERRVRKQWTSASGVAQEVRYFGILEEVINGGTRSQDTFLVFNGRRVARKSSLQPTATQYLHGDLLGSTSLVTSETGAVLERRNYAPFGNPYRQDGAATTRYGFTGEEHDTEIGQIHLGIREFHFAIGRFAGPDPIIPGSHPQATNRFSYVFNRPTMFSDPSGYEPVVEAPGDEIKPGWGASVSIFSKIAMVADKKPTGLDADMRSFLDSSDSRRKVIGDPRANERREKRGITRVSGPGARNALEATRGDGLLGPMIDELNQEMDGEIQIELADLSGDKLNAGALTNPPKTPGAPWVIQYDVSKLASNGITVDAAFAHEVSHIYWQLHPSVGPYEMIKIYSWVGVGRMNWTEEIEVNAITQGYQRRNGQIPTALGDPGQIGIRNPVFAK